MQKSFQVYIIKLVIKMFGDKLIQLRKSKNMTQRDLAACLNLTHTSIGKYERNEAEPDFATLKKITEIFDVTIDYLLGADDSNIILITRKDLEGMKEVERHLQSAMDQLVSITEKIQTNNDQSITIGDGNTIQNSFNRK